tara:strand:+ start:189 stop:485 length:297 start_codon:yes stop_codon:yes gene_type:complete
MKKQNKIERLQEAKQQHADFLKSMGYTGNKGSQAVIPFPNYRCDVEGISPTSNFIAGVNTKEDNTYKLNESKNYTVAPAYNKSGYMVVSKKNIKDIGR